jgi:hypothetical protein
MCPLTYADICSRYSGLTTRFIAGTRSCSLCVL